jgi:phosphatidylinositol alpha-1,6-mannosyltransferase
MRLLLAPMIAGNSPMLLLTDKFAPHPGGTAVIYRQWCDRLPPETVRVLTCWFPGWREFDASRPYRIERVPFVNIPKLRMPLVWAGLCAQALKTARAAPPPVVHVGQILETGLTALLLRRRYGTPYVVHTYGEEINYYHRFRSTRAWMRTVLRHASAVTSISRYTAGRMAQLGLWNGPVTLLYPAAETARFDGAGGEAVRARHGLGSAPVLLTVARLLRRKGHDRVLEALTSIRRRVPGVRYLIVGAGREEARLRELATRYGVRDAVVFAGAVPHGEVPAYFAASDVFVHPNRELESGDVEGFGIVFLEAGACRLPVIGGNSGGAPDAIRDGVTGFLVDPNSPAEIAERAIALLEDRSLRARMGEAGREWAAQFTWEAAARKVSGLSSAASGTPVPVA